LRWRCRNLYFNFARGRSARSASLEELDKAELGKRIRQIRLGRGLRQWELARRLGTTQSAVHKYEHGVVPEPRRLIELAKVGNTSIEWVLTGRHWENGSTTQERVPGDVLATAYMLNEVSTESRERLEEALRIIRDAVRSLGSNGGDAQPPSGAAVGEALSSYSRETIQLLESAWRIQQAVLRRVTRDAEQRLSASDTPPVDDATEGAR
jgi:transcriptional regulator with XRE-family HTH domain